MDNINRMMHYPQGYGMGMDDQSQGGQQQPTSPSAQPGAGEQEVGGGQEGVRGHASINTILDQIMTITDQSIDEVHLNWTHSHSSTTFQLSMISEARISAFSCVI